MTTLDGVERALTPEDLLICDAERAPQAIAGIMGGSTSEVSDATTEILLESAYFERMGIARSSKRLKLRSESSARFERGIDPDAVARNAERGDGAARRGGRRAGRARRVRRVPRAGRAGPHPPAREPGERGARHRPRRRGRVGLARAARHRARRRRRPTAPIGDTVVAIVPTFRPDLDREIDLVEEVARRIGFDRIGRTLPDTHGQVGMLTARQQERRLVADALVGVGLSEAITLSLVAPADLERAGAPLDRVVRATNPLRAEESVLRTAVLPGLLRAVAGNRAQGLGDVALFEMGRVFLTPLGPARGRRSAARRARARRAGVGGQRAPPPGRGRPRRSTCTTRSTRVTAVRRRAAGSTTSTLEPATLTGYRAGRAAAGRGRRPRRRHRRRGRARGARRARARRRRWSPPSSCSTRCSTPPAATARSARRRASRRRPIDLAFVVDDARRRRRRRAHAARPRSATCSRTCARSTCSVRDALGAGRRSLAFALRFRAPDRTLTDAEVGTLRQQAIDAVDRRARRRTARVTAFVHHVRPRYAEVDVQGVVFNAHWLTYFDEASTRFFESLGFEPVGRVLPGVRRDGGEGGRRVAGPGRVRRRRRDRGGAGPDRHQVVRPRLHRDGRRAVRRASARSPTCR